MRDRSYASTASRIGAITAFLTLAIGASAQAVAGNPEPSIGVPPASTSAPIRIDACAVRGPRSGWLFLSFTNEANQEMNEVRIRVTFRGVTRVVVDAGRFAPGVLINRQYPYEFEAPTHRADAVCDVSSVHYVDGTIWKMSPTNAT